ncbi:MAG: FecR domain-containing protein [Rhodoferax sp.]|uniref:DUF6600 domain-containing protein n=1 Tax=Rhodoferax sp. TaxID=50421 RepID=UPI0013FF6852|nr:DUF6600 domain-containing protein [Rhodoferax sp.]NDP39660.1 FecR domain-containing protein [Rhodoferax sp.]
MKRPSLGFHVVTFLIGVAAVFFAGAASADPPSRVARLAYTLGTVSFSPAGENDWVDATVNRPLTLGDRLWVDGLARAEVELGGTMIRLNANTSLSVLNLDDRVTQLQLTQGTLSLRVRRLAPDQLIEVHAPNLVLTLHQAGDYRIAVDPDSAATDVIVRAGQAEVLGQGTAYTVDARQAYRFDGPDLRTYDYLNAPPLDEFDQWALSRDRAFANSRSARYVSPDVIGYQDLDANGSWIDDVSYGPVWTPHRVAVGWAPYRDGHWAWIHPWGWTWVDDAPWGFAVSHYGRWAHLRGGWAWVPGPLHEPAYYAPALVMFVGGDNFRLQLSSGPVGGVAWFPLAPREVYRPAFPVSRRYFDRVNRSNTVVHINDINRSYDSHRSRNSEDLRHEDYRNRRVPGAVVAVPTNTFVQSQPVHRATVRLPPATFSNAPLALVPPVAPTERSVRGAGAPGERPLVRGFERPPGHRTAPQVAPALVAPASPQGAPPPQVVPNPVPWPRPVMRSPESRRWPQPLDSERRGAPPDPRPFPPPSPTANGPASAAPMPAPRQRAPEQRLAAPTMAPPMPVLPVPPPQPAPPNPAPRAIQPAVAALPASQTAPAAPVAAPGPQSPPHQAQADPTAQPRGPRPPPGARKLRDGEDDGNPPRRGAEERQQRR